LSEFSARVTPPTAVAQGESAGAFTVAGIPRTVKSPSSPEEKLVEIPDIAAISEIRFSVSSADAGVRDSTEP
jgi:hypothetical protein